MDSTEQEHIAALAKREEAEREAKASLHRVRLAEAREMARHRASLRLASAMAAMSGVEFSVVLPTLFNYIQERIAPGASLSAVSALNLSLALFSTSSIVAKPIVGWAVGAVTCRTHACRHLKNTRLPSHVEPTLNTILVASAIPPQTRFPSHP
jgi:hypothetical protein